VHEPVKPIAIADPQPGERWGDITFAAFLQKGMSSNLYMTWHHGYMVAMVCKMMRAAERDNLRWRELLRSEGEILRAVAHPNIVRVFELNMDAPLAYLLLDYLPGQTIKQILRQSGPFELQDALRLSMHLGSTLSHVHNCGFLHRDVKPSNVILHGGWLKLLDFGVAWPISNLTPPDKSGTPAYLSPEQCRQGILTPAVDLWALGIFLFELLTGEKPFPKGDYHNYNAPLEIRYPQLAHPPKTLKQANCIAPDGLQQVLDRCLALEPAERYASVKEFLIELDPFCQTKIWPVLPQTDNANPDLASFLN